jgi:hypothetical protein
MALAGMIFVLILVAMVGGFILLLPISRRLGRLMDVRLEEKRGAGRSEELEELRRAVLALESEVSSLAERQHFTDQLLQGNERDRLEP